MTLRLALWIVTVGVCATAIVYRWRDATWPMRVLWCITIVGLSLWYWDIPLFHEWFPVFFIVVMFASLILMPKNGHRSSAENESSE